jgi:hypothetical protein
VDGPPAWGLSGGLTTLPVKLNICYESLRTALEQDGLLGIRFGGKARRKETIWKTKA